MDVTARLTRAEERVAAFDLKRVIESPLTTIGIAAALAISALMEIADRMSALALLAALLATAPQALRRSQPWLAVVLTLMGALGLLAAGVNWLPVAVGLSGVLSFYTILCRLSRGAAWILTACVGAPLLLIWLAATLRSYWYSPVNGTTMVAILGTVVATALLADVRRSRTEIKKVRADNLETLREQAAMAERAKIAREMHDIVAHSVSMIAVQAETAPYTLEGLDDRTKQEFAEIAAGARTTLTEMRRLLGVLRADVTTAPETAPQPGLALLPELLERHEGVVDLDVVGEAEPVPQAVDVSAYRIVQEALTNARVHAPGARVSIELTYRPAMLVLRIADDGPGPAGSPSNGHGLVGMRERALALGGWFKAGAGPAGGFLIQAGLPLE
ncbi:sensor histidine kinase [Streptosporangium lutulentum]|uniref:histidine kinase n=1 Tax=Streptosporangium lutulentum TaxID=1461250 RepID=A0ABT9QI96_9ACTN|nr:sensor histidine kinase [Streptosporangium lutulentum]MDP9846458.1 signal transduction histidine kinase [Streptosporangium lutulentum]